MQYKASGIMQKKIDELNDDNTFTAELTPRPATKCGRLPRSLDPTKYVYKRQLTQEYPCHHLPKPNRALLHGRQFIEGGLLELPMVHHFRPRFAVRANTPPLVVDRVLAHVVSSNNQRGATSRPCSSKLSA